MAEQIYKYLDDYLKVEEALATKLKVPTKGEHAPLKRVSNDSYKMNNDAYFIKLHQDKGGKKEVLQYATFYWLRLNSLKPHVKECAEIKWAKDKGSLVYVENILDIRPHQMTVIIGTLFKEMALKPSILKNITGILGTKKFNYVSEDDYAVLEDKSGRIRIKKGTAFDPVNFVTGTIVALKGVVDTNGFFEVRDHCYAGIPFTSSVPRYVNIDLQRDLYDGIENECREFVAFVSGLQFGLPGDNVLSTELLVRFLRGELGGAKNAKLASLISRVVIAGNSIVQPDEYDQVLRGSYRMQGTNQKVYKSISDVLDTFEAFLSKLTDFIDVDVMPGSDDFSSAFMPQQPINSCLFPQLEDAPALNLVTNPHRFSINGGLTFLGTSGQNIRDIFLQTKCENTLDALQLTLESRHLCPTAPDTLRAYPQIEEDPFVIDQCPHVYFTGNMDAYEERLVQPINSGNSKTVYKQACKIISIPEFSKTKSIVLLDVTTLQSYEIKFSIGESVMPSRESGMVIDE